MRVNAIQTVAEERLRPRHRRKRFGTRHRAKSIGSSNRTIMYGTMNHGNSHRAFHCLLWLTVRRQVFDCEKEKEQGNAKSRRFAQCVRQSCTNPE